MPDVLFFVEGGTQSPPTTRHGHETLEDLPYNDHLRKANKEADCIIIFIYSSLPSLALRCFFCGTTQGRGRARRNEASSAGARRFNFGLVPRTSGPPPFSGATSFLSLVMAAAPRAHARNLRRVDRSAAGAERP